MATLDELIGSWALSLRPANRAARTVAQYVDESLAQFRRWMALHEPDVGPRAIKRQHGWPERRTDDSCPATASSGPNGLLRRYFPKGTDLSRWNAEEIDAVAHALNSRPCKMLHWRTPAEALDELKRCAVAAGIASPPTETCGARNRSNPLSPPSLLPITDP
jgi:hypothetical protein